MEELDGKSIDLTGSSSKVLEIDTSAKRKYVLKKDQTTVHSILRPVVRNDLDGSTSVGPAFSGTYNLTEKIDIRMVSSSERDALPVKKNVLQYPVNMHSCPLLIYRFGLLMCP